MPPSSFAKGHEKHIERDTDTPFYMVDPAVMVASCRSMDRERLEKILEDPTCAAQVAYYAKGTNAKVRKVLNEHFNQQRLETDLDHFPPIVHLNEQQRVVFFSRMHCMQLTYGCNGGCRKCGFDAAPQSQEHIPFRIIEAIINKYGSHKTETPSALYWASDPLDYRYRDPVTGKTYTYKDVEELVENKLGYLPDVFTSLPSGSEKIAESLKVIHRISVMPENKERIDALAPEKWENVVKNGIEKINVGNMNIQSGTQGNLETSRKVESGIGCYNGTLLTPRGAYSIVQNPGLNTASPQKQFVIPFLGNNPQRPHVGEDIRSLLAQHMPHYIRTDLIQIAAGTQSVPMFCTIDDPDFPDRILVVIWKGSTITGVNDADSYFHKSGNANVRTIINKEQEKAKSKIQQYQQLLDNERSQIQGVVHDRQRARIQYYEQCVNEYTARLELMINGALPKIINTILLEEFSLRYWQSTFRKKAA